MAIGFSMSSVNEILVDPTEGAIYFELKNIRYKIVIDDIKRAEELITAINEILGNVRKASGSSKKLPDFYKQLER